MNGRLIGYARVSTTDQNLDLQIDALRQHGCKRALIYLDQSSGAKTERTGLDSCLANLKKGDTLVVWRIDRLSRSLSHLVSLVEDLGTRGINFQSICDGGIDTTSASGEFIFNLFASLAQMERRIIQERTKAGLESARSRGKLGGRPRLTKNSVSVRIAKKLSLDNSMTIKDICHQLVISRSTYYRYLNM